MIADRRLASRSGIGYDSHRFAPGGPLTLGGVKIPSDVHLHGHSDGDAIAHAATDAILGAAALGDIGEMFADTDPANAGRDSIGMLQAANARLTQAGWRVAQVDIVVIAETPKIAPHREQLNAGDVVLAGSFTRPINAERGDTFHADYGPLGAVAFRFV